MKRMMTSVFAGVVALCIGAGLVSTATAQPVTGFTDPLEW